MPRSNLTKVRLGTPLLYGSVLNVFLQLYQHSFRQEVRNGDNDQTRLTFFRVFSLFVLTFLCPMTKFSSRRECTVLIWTAARHVFLNMVKQQIKTAKNMSGARFRRKTGTQLSRLFHVYRTSRGVQLLVVSNTASITSLTYYLIKTHLMNV